MPLQTQMSVSVVESAVAIAIIALVISRRGEGWRRFGITRPGLLTIPAGLVMAALDLVTWILYFNLVPLFSNTVAQDNLTPESIAELNPALVVTWTLLGVAATRLVFSSYLLIRLGTVFRSVWKSVLVSSAMYGLLFVDYGFDVAAATSAVNIAYCIIFIMFRRLWPLILGNLLVQVSDLLDWF